MSEQKPEKVSWFKRKGRGIDTPTEEKLDTPEGVWWRCPECKKTTTTEEYKDKLWCCPACNYHGRIGSNEYFSVFFDGGEHTLLFENIMSKDALNFKDIKDYESRLQDALKKSNYTDALSVGLGKIEGRESVICCMNFEFIGGSMGVVVGERISRAIDHCVEHHLPLMIISKSGGARMMESGFSLMQMAKTSAKLTLLSKHQLPYISLCTDPTTGGVTASYAMLGDINIAEPKALIGFAGPRVVKETIKKDLPKGFQSAEFVLESGFLDLIVERKDLKQKVSVLIEHLMGE
ncbi:MAG: acetyl-CoA carboxylase carboxyltransferase subunit beta [Bacteroidetes bacterium]|jgi:acetyl-CoA carboxylase carboxyl transferase subunit beta|nr:acetyl-CoA carboxylase carboxyltransferase subunit beta [Bacteroidota bacterium]MBK7569538.1 acetyl-CoA carboxylase carboxyltransferase subunit beta [Bacteroidota bacterium]MBP8917086.1 acetyl-CoA carboxylase carboxyltransferase subunit beta [Chitinophagales bacterium]